MKHNYTHKLRAFVATAALALVVVACGLKISEVTFSSHELKSGENLTITTKFDRADSEYQNNEGIYLYYGVRVPSEWTVAEMLKATDTNSMMGDSEFEFEESEFYSKLMNLCYPKDGYKWIGFQTLEPKTIAGEPTVATVTLATAGAAGEYELDIVAGSSKNAPIELLTENGEINYELIFNNKKTLEDTDYNSFAEYLANAATLTEEEVEARKYSLKDITANGLAISPCDVANKRVEGLDLKVKLEASQDETGVADVVADGVEVKAISEGVIVKTTGTAQVVVCNAAGNVIDENVVNAEGILKAQQGVCFVTVVAEGKTTTYKVIVK